MSRRAARDALLLGGLALLLRLGAQAHAAVLSRDALGYLETARAWEAGRWSDALGHTYPPGFPLALALAGRLAGGLSEGVALATAALLAALLAPLVFALTRAAAGEPAARFAGLLAAILPALVDLGAEAIADATFVAVLAGAVVCAARAAEAPRAAPGAVGGAALLGGLAYLTRPEGIVALGGLLGGLLLLPRAPGAGGGRRRAQEAAWLLGGGALLVLPFLLAIKGRGVPEGDPAAPGRLVGAWKLTLKRDLGERLALLGPGLLLERAGLFARAFLVAAAPALPFLALGLRRPPARARRLLPLLALPLLALLLAALLVRVDRRYAATPAALMLPWAGLGAARAAAWLRARGLTRAPAVLALALALPCLGAALRPRHSTKLTYRDAGALLQAAGARRVLAFDSRAAYYAQAELVSLWHELPGDQAQFRDPDALLRAVTAARPDAVVLEVGDPASAAAAAELGRRLGVAPVPVRRDGAAPLDVLLLGPR